MIVIRCTARRKEGRKESINPSRKEGRKEVQANEYNTLMSS